MDTQDAHLGEKNEATVDDYTGTGSTNGPCACEYSAQGSSRSLSAIQTSSANKQTAFTFNTQCRPLSYTGVVAGWNLE